MKMRDALLDAPAATTVRRFGDADRGSWEAYVAACPTATFFHRIGWKDIMERVLKHRTHYLLAERNDHLAGILPLAEVNSLLFGHALVSLPFAAYGGVAADDADAAAALTRAAVQAAKDLGVSHLELRNLEVRQPDWPRQDLYVTFRKQILPDVEANMLAIPRKQRAMVRKGIQRGLRVQIDPNVDRFYELFADNVQRHGTPTLAKRYFQALQETFGADCEVSTVLSPEGRAVSSVLSFYFRDEVLPYYAGDLPEARDLAANDFKYWDLMRRACERGLRTFDYGRSKRGTGQFDFKKNWGFEPHALQYEYALLKRDSIPQNNPANPKYRAFIAAWRHLPRGVARTLGPLIVRNLG